MAKRQGRKPRYSEDDVKAIHDAARRVWQEIGYDILTTTPRCTMKREHVVEVVCDAGRLEQKIRDPRLRNLVSHDMDIDQIVIEAFPHSRYGL